MLQISLSNKARNMPADVSELNLPDTSMFSVYYQPARRERSALGVAHLEPIQAFLRQEPLQCRNVRRGRRCFPQSPLAQTKLEIALQHRAERGLSYFETRRFSIIGGSLDESTMKSPSLSSVHRPDCSVGCSEAITEQEVPVSS